MNKNEKWFGYHLTSKDPYDQHEREFK